MLRDGKARFFRRPTWVHWTHRDQRTADIPPLPAFDLGEKVHAFSQSPHFSLVKVGGRWTRRHRSWTEERDDFWQLTGIATSSFGLGPRAFTTVALTRSRAGLDRRQGDRSPYESLLFEFPAETGFARDTRGRKGGLNVHYSQDILMCRSLTRSPPAYVQTDWCVVVQGLWFDVIFL